MKIYADSTLRGMKKDDLIAIIRCLEHNISVEEERNQNQFNLLMQEDIRKERYKWHDLRENPNDLPDNDRLVDCRTTDKQSAYYGHYVEKAENGESIDLWIDTEDFMIQVVAWREVEPFESEVEE